MNKPLEVLEELAPVVLNRQNAARFLNVSADYLDSLEELPQFPPDCMVVLHPANAKMKDKLKKHYTVEGLRTFVRNCIDETRRMVSAAEAQRRLEQK